MQAGAGWILMKKKQNPLDFALWKGSKPGNLSGKAPGEKERPGWHIECSVMSQKYLGETFDIHGGGRDLTFPHHENEIAQSEGATGKPFVRYWIHNGFVNINQEKMSKSLGNILTSKKSSRIGIRRSFASSFSLTITEALWIIRKIALTMQESDSTNFTLP